MAAFNEKQTNRIDDLKTLNKIISINIGMPILIDFKGKQIQTGINKQPIFAPVYLSTLNFEGDGQADLVHHGGKDKAVCVYPFDHYRYWEETLDRELDYGAFGENITLTGLCEADVAIGDIFQLGEAIVQVSQPRQPCFKLAARYDRKNLPIRIEETGFTGYYFRVLKEGWVSHTSTIKVVKRHPKRMTVQYANTIMHHDKNNVEAIKEILAVDELSTSWRTAFMKRLNEV